MSQNRYLSVQLLFAVLFVLAGSGTLLAADVTLQWDANTETDLAGYKLYYGTAPGVYGSPIVVGKVTTYTLTGVAPGTYYFAVTAYNNTGVESGFSNEVTTTIPATTSACDLNADGATNALDLQVMINAILGIPAATGRDLNGDGKVDALDLQILGNVILGVRSCPL